MVKKAVTGRPSLRRPSATRSVIPDGGGTQGHRELRCWLAGAHLSSLQ